MTDQIAAGVAALRDSEEVGAILSEVCRVTGMGFAAVACVTAERWIACQVLDKIEFGLQPGDELELKTTICDEIRRSGDAVVIDNVPHDKQWRKHATPILYGFQSYASFPIRLADGSVFGTLCAIDPDPRSVRAPEVIAMFERYATRIGKILSERLPA